MRLVRPTDTGSGGQLFGSEHAKPPAPADLRQAADESRWDGHDTIGTLALDGAGTLAGACSTSGTPFKLPGRVGDSPIIGHGLYVDTASGGGAATATGTGELIMAVCASFLVVESMRRGASPLEAIRVALERITSRAALKPHHQVALLALDHAGGWASGALRPGFLCSVRDRDGSRVVEPNFVLVSE